jgi:hypothetical protein
MLNDYVSYYSSEYIVVRGGHASKYYECKCCGSVTSEWEEPPYVLRSDLGHRDVNTDALCNLYVSETCVSEVDWEQYSDIELYPFDVHEDVL